MRARGYETTPSGYDSHHASHLMMIHGYVDGDGSSDDDDGDGEAVAPHRSTVASAAQGVQRVGG